MAAPENFKKGEGKLWKGNTRFSLHTAKGLLHLDFQLGGEDSKLALVNIIYIYLKTLWRMDLNLAGAIFFQLNELLLHV